MVAAGIIAENERFELIGGEIVPMSARGIPHEAVKLELNRYWSRFIPDEINLITETTLRVDEHNFREPDFLFWPRSLGIEGLNAASILLLVEVADSSLSYDLGDKMNYYASIGITEYLVINARTLATRIHRKPTDSGYASVANVPYTERLTPAALPDLALRLADLGLLPQPDSEA